MHCTVYRNIQEAETGVYTITLPLIETPVQLLIREIIQLANHVAMAVIAVTLTLAWFSVPDGLV